MSLPVSIWSRGQGILSYFACIMHSNHFLFCCYVYIDYHFTYMTIKDYYNCVFHILEMLEKSHRAAGDWKVFFICYGNIEYRKETWKDCK